MLIPCEFLLTWPSKRWVAKKNGQSKCIFSNLGDFFPIWSVERLIEEVIGVKRDKIKLTPCPRKKTQKNRKMYKYGVREIHWKHEKSQCQYQFKNIFNSIMVFHLSAIYYFFKSPLAKSSFALQMHIHCEYYKIFFRGKFYQWNAFIFCSHAINIYFEKIVLKCMSWLIPRHFSCTLAYLKKFVRIFLCYYKVLYVIVVSVCVYICSIFTLQKKV